MHEGVVCSCCMQSYAVVCSLPPLLDSGLWNEAHSRPLGASCATCRDSSLLLPRMPLSAVSNGVPGGLTYSFGLTLCVPLLSSTTRLYYRCPTVRRSPHAVPNTETVYRPADLSNQQWFIDPEYYWFQECDCAAVSAVTECYQQRSWLMLHVYIRVVSCSGGWLLEMLVAEYCWFQGE